MIEDLEEEERPSMNQGFTDTWLTRRRTWDDKARTLKVLSLLFFSCLTESYMPLHPTSTLPSQISSRRPQKMCFYSRTTPRRHWMPFYTDI